MTEKPQQLTVGEKVTVKVNGQPVQAEYVAWSEKYNMAVVQVDGKRLFRKIFDGPPVAQPTEERQDKPPVGDGHLDGRTEYRNGEYFVFSRDGKLKHSFKPSMTRSTGTRAGTRQAVPD